MLNVMVTGLLCISTLPVALSCNLSAVIVNFYANINKKKEREYADDKLLVRRKFSILVNLNVMQVLVL